MLDSSAAQFAFVLSFSLSLALVLALVVSWPRLIVWLGRSWRRRLGLTLSLTLPLILLLLLFTLFTSTIYIFPVFFGFLAALGTSQLLLFNRRSQATMAESLPWLTIFLFSVIAGLFPQVSTGLLSSLREARIETTGIHLILAEQRSRDAQLPVFEFDAQPLVTARTWAYKSGTQSLRNLTYDVLNDTTLLIEFCGLSPFKQFCGGIDSVDGRAFLYATRDYFEAIRPLVQCLAAYGYRFPNGLPLQDELSEIAIGFGRRDTSADESFQREDDLERLLSNIVAQLTDTSIIGETSSSDKMTNNEATLSDDELPSSSNDTCEGLLGNSLDKYYADKEHDWINSIESGYEGKSATYCDREFVDPNKILGCKVWKLISIAGRYWRQNWIHEAKPPYRSLFETYIITAAGYPQDAAYYIEREYDAYIKQGRRNYGRLANWLFSLRLLHSRERMLEEGKDFYKQSIALRDLSEEYDEFFMGLVGTVKIARLLRYCDARWEDIELWEDISKAGAEPSVREFLSKALFSHIRAEMRRWQTQNKNGVSRAELREVGDDFATLFADRERFFGGCFTGWDHGGERIKKQVGDQLLEMHAELGLTSGSIRLAELLSAIERREEYEELTLEERSVLLCSARDVFQRVKDVLPATLPEGSWQESAWERASKFSEAINDWNPQC